MAHVSPLCRPGGHAQLGRRERARSAGLRRRRRRRVVERATRPAAASGGGRGRGAPVVRESGDPRGTAVHGQDRGAPRHAGGDVQERSALHREAVAQRACRAALGEERRQGSHLGADVSPSRTDAQQGAQYFCATKKTIANGMIAITAAAICCGPVVPGSPCSRARPTSTTFISTVRVATSGHRKFLHWSTNANTATVASAGLLSGNTTRQKIVHSPAPSSRAAAS